LIWKPETKGFFPMAGKYKQKKTAGPLREINLRSEGYWEGLSATGNDIARHKRRNKKRSGKVIGGGFLKKRLPAAGEQRASGTNDFRSSSYGQKRQLTTFRGRVTFKRKKETRWCRRTYPSYAGRSTPQRRIHAFLQVKETYGKE